MPPVHPGPLLVRTAPRTINSAYICNSCATRNFSQARVLSEANATPPKVGPERPANRRQGAQMAGRMIQGLRAMAPGGFGRGGPSDGAPRTTIRRQPSANSASRPTNTPGGQSPVQRGSQQQRSPQRKQNATPGGAPSRSRKDEQNEEPEPRPLPKPAKDTARKLVQFLSTPSEDAVDIAAARSTVDKLLVNRFHKGKVVRFANDAHRKRLLSNKEATRAQTEDGVPKLVLPKGYREWLTSKAVSGKYEALKPVEGTKDTRKRTMAQLQTSMLRNGSYNKAAQQAMLEFMGKVWPGQAQAKAS